jgi:hypothetical protein
VLSADAYAAFEESLRPTARPAWKPAALPEAILRSAAAARPWSPSRPSAAASPASTPCCATGHGLNRMGPAAHLVPLPALPGLPAVRDGLPTIQAAPA